MYTNNIDLNILIIEDNEGDFIIAKNLLKKSFTNLRIKHVKTFSEAKNTLLNPNQFNCILLDLSLPDANGEGLIKGLIQLKNEIPITIVLTGNNDLDFAVKTLSMGISDYLIKDELTTSHLQKSIFYSLERHKISLERNEAVELEILSNEKYKLLVEQSSEGILLVDKQGNILEINNSALELFEINKKEALESDYFYLTQQFEQEFNPFENSNMKKGKVLVKEIKLKTKKGNNKDIEIHEKILSSGNLQSLIRDITIRKKQEKELIEAKSNTEKALDIKTAFLRNISHELRTPINSIIGFSDLLKETSISTEQNNYINYVIQSGYFLLELVNQILDFSILESKSLELKIEKFDLYKLLKETSNFVKFKINNKDIKTILNINNDVPQFIYADSIRLKQILLNLLMNAIKFTDKGEIEISVMVTKELKIESECVLLFSVKDTGIGISNENQKKIFEPFIQIEDSLSKKYQGTGLGLSICNELLQLMNSKLQIESEINKGSNFFFPLQVRIDKFKEQTLSNNLNSEKNLPFNPEEIKILIVDDEELNLILLENLINIISPRYKILKARDGKKALEIASREKLSLIFMDIKMPELDGIEATKKIRTLEKDNGNVPIIAITAGTVQEFTWKISDAGINEFYNKPISLMIIKNIINKYILLKMGKKED